MRELNNIPESVLYPLFLKDKRGEITKRMGGYIDTFYKDDAAAVKGYVGGDVVVFFEILRKYHKIFIIRDLYNVRDIERMALEYLYSGYGPIMLMEINSSDQIIYQLSVRVLINRIKEEFGLKHYDDEIELALKDGGCKKPINPACFKFRVSKVRKMDVDKFLIQLRCFEKYFITVDDKLELIELPTLKFINCVLDSNRRFLQIRTSPKWAKKIMPFFTRLFAPGIFEEIKFDEALIELLKYKLRGKTYQYLGKRKGKIKVGEISEDLKTGIPDDDVAGVIRDLKENKNSSVIDRLCDDLGKRKGEITVDELIGYLIKGKIKESRLPFILWKALRKHGSIPFDIRCSPDFDSETLDYDLKSDLFRYRCDKEMVSVEDCMKLELTVDVSRLFFRMFATESVIDHALDMLAGALRGEIVPPYPKAVTIPVALHPPIAQEPAS